MEGLIPWERLEGLIRSHYPRAGRGRRPYELSALLRIHCVQLFYNLSDPGMEDLLYEAKSVRRFVGLRLSGPLPDGDDDTELPAPVGRAPVGGGTDEGDQRSSGVTGSSSTGGDDSGR